MELPRNVKTAGSIPLYMQFAKLQEGFGLPISLPGFSPIEFVRGTCGLETLCRWLVRKPELVHRLLRLATDYSREVVRYWVDTFFPQRILVQTWLAYTVQRSNTLFSPHLSKYPQEVKPDNLLYVLIRVSPSHQPLGNLNHPGYILIVFFVHSKTSFNNNFI